MTPTHQNDNDQEFRHSLLERWGIGFCLALLWLMVILMAGFAASFFIEGVLMLSLFMAGITGFFSLLCRMVHRDFLMKNAWRIALGPLNAWFNLPVWRLLYGPQPSMSGPLAYSAIRAVEWREEVTRTMGMTTINRVYAMRLKSGTVIILGEDRPIPKTMAYTRLAGDAARALSQMANAPLRQLPMAEGKAGFLTILGASRPGWPEGETASLLSEDDERAIRRGLLITQLSPVVAFAIVILAAALTQ